MNSDNTTRELGLREYLGVAWVRRSVILATLVVVVGATLGASYLQKRVYAATAEVLLQGNGAADLLGVQSAYTDPVRVIQTQIRVIESEPVRLRVQAKLGSAPAVTAKAVSATDVITIRAESTSPAFAARVANTYAEEYIALKREQAINDIVAATEQIREKLTKLEGQVHDLDGQIAAANDPNSAVRQGLVSSRDVMVVQQGEFRRQLDQLEVAQALKTGGAQVVKTAVPPTEPARPRPVRNGIAAIGIGLLFGVAIAFLIEYLDDSIKHKDDVAKAVPDLPVIGLIPAVPSWRSKEQTRLVSSDEPSSPAAEAYRTLRTSIQFLSLDGPVRTVLVTSASAREGKSTTVANLGIALAKAGQRVVIVGCDLRRPRIHEFFGLSNAVGFTSVLLGETGLPQAMQRVPGVERLFLLASGPLPPNPSELLSSRRCAELLESLRSQGYMVLVDSPPVLPVTDAMILAKGAGSTVLVCAAGKTGRKHLARAVEMLGQVNAPLSGVVLNGVTPGGVYSYAYDYGTPDVAPGTSAKRNGTSRRKARRKTEALVKRR